MLRHSFKMFDGGSLPSFPPLIPAVWDSSIVLAKYLEMQASLVKDKRCLDLSSGCGLVGIVLSHLGASEVVCTDLAANLELLRNNCQSNGEQINFR